MAGDVFSFDQPTHKNSCRAAARIDREHLATEPPNDARYVDPTSARVAPRSRASQLARRYDPLNVVDTSIAGLGVKVTMPVMEWTNV